MRLVSERRSEPHSGVIAVAETNKAFANVHRRGHRRRNVRKVARRSLLKRGRLVDCQFSVAELRKAPAISARGVVSGPADVCPACPRSLVELGRSADDGSRRPIKADQIAGALRCGRERVLIDRHARRGRRIAAHRRHCGDSAKPLRRDVDGVRREGQHYSLASVRTTSGPGNRAAFSVASSLATERR